VADAGAPLTADRLLWFRPDADYVTGWFYIRGRGEVLGSFCQRVVLVYRGLTWICSLEATLIRR
jgi:hypothetical protein